MLYSLALFSMLLIKTLIETYNKKAKKYCNSSNKEQERARARATTGNSTLQKIQDIVNNETDKKMTKTQAIIVPAIANQTPDSITDTATEKPTNQAKAQTEKTQT